MTRAVTFGAADARAVLARFRPLGTSSSTTTRAAPTTSVASRRTPPRR